MRRIDRALQSVTNDHRRENYSGPLASTGAGGHSASVNNLYNSQVRDAMTVMPYGISSRPFSGMKAQTVVNDNSSNTVVGIYDPSRPKVNTGEICLYSSGGCSIYLSKGGDVSVKSNGAEVDVKRSGAVNISNNKGSLSMDVGGNCKMSNSDGYSIMVGLFQDESSDGESDGEEQVNGITFTANDVKATFDGETGEINIIKEETTGIKISETNEISIFKEETAATISISEENDIDIKSGETIGINIKNDGAISAYNDVASATIKNTGEVNIVTTKDIKFDTTGNIEFKCKEFKVNDVTVP